MLTERKKNAIIEMSKRGTKHEKNIANELINRYKISVTDEEKKDYTFKYKTKFEKQLLFQVWRMVKNDKSDTYYTNRNKRNCLLFKLTKKQSLEIELFYSVLKAELKKEFELTLAAFIHKNDLFDDFATGSGKKPDEEQIKRLQARYDSMNKTQIRKQLIV